ncbi:MAG TPA: DUF1800 domain-containing protein [Frateuria sp.]|uniref:DUF1800 domain-containing protein n=1 Tax=Frateuria sp. TaxID=2211372 RepID=UPI002DF551DF|nr:DUF1800 domain-containing protein [Frateuria sp.]
MRLITRVARSCRGIAWIAAIVALGAGPLQAADAPLPPDAIAWLQRDGFGVDSTALAQYRRLGREGLLDAQLDDRLGDTLPAPIRAQVDAMDIARLTPAALAATLGDARRRLRTLPDPDKREARKTLRQQGNALAEQAREDVLLHAVYGPNQLKEQMVWFWLNHFSVFARKGEVNWLVADYAEHSIRPHALGKFRDLVMATLQSPAMLVYLDNAQNASDKLNENYARELMELHTLGVDAGYTQQDVQQLARILTGVGLAPMQVDGPRGRGRRGPLPLGDGLAAFVPRRHDDGDKQLLGQHLRGGGFDEVRRAVDLIVSQPACARFVSRQLAEYFVADTPPPALVERMAQTFQHSDGDIAQVLRTMFSSPELIAARGGKFKDPTQFVVSAVRFVADGRPVDDASPIARWLAQLGEPLFGRPTPDGWPLDGASWSSAGQMTERFAVARAIGNGRGLWKDAQAVPALDGPLYQAVLAPRLSARTRAALAQAGSRQEWNAFLLASPEFNYR